MVKNIKYTAMPGSAQVHTEWSSLYGREKKGCAERTLGGWLMTIICVSSFLLLFLISILVIKSRENSSIPVAPSHPPRPCSSSSCKAAAKDVEKLMDMAADPCEDFYQYSCGKWAQVYPPPKGMQHWTNFVRLDRNNLEIIRNGLEGEGKRSHNSAVVKKAKSFYRACLDEDDLLDQLGAKPLRDAVHKMDLNVTSVKSLTRALAKLHTQFGLSVFFTWTVGINDKDSSKHIIKVDQAELTLSRDDYITKNATAKENAKKALLIYMKEVTQLVRGHNVTKKEEEDLRKLMKLEEELADVMLKPSVHRKTEHQGKMMSLSVLTKKTGFVNWESFASKTVKSKDGDTVEGSEKVILGAWDNLEGVSAIVHKYLNTKEGKQVLQDYLIWRMMDEYGSYLSKDFRQAEYDLTCRLLGWEFAEVRDKKKWRSCLKETGNVFKFALGNIYLKEIDQKLKTVDSVAKIIKHVKEALENNFKENPWMDKEAKKAAMKKSKHIAHLVGFPDYVTNTKKLESMYGDVEVDEDDYFNNILNNVRNKKDPAKQLKKLRKSVKTTGWISAPQSVNAFYTAVMNEILIPIGILQPPFYQHDRPQVLNYGGIGFSTGHELSHAFDDNGRRYNLHGDLEDWWTKQTIKRFTEHTSCLVDQYGGYSVGGKLVHGNNTLGENIADNGGIKAAYDGYFDRRPGRQMFKPLAGLNLTEAQMFFVGFAQVWCNANTEQYEVNKLLTNPHAPSKVRVLGTVTNSKEFAKAFQCTEKARLNPVQKCTLW